MSLAEVGGDELQEIQTELQHVKKALREGGDYLHMKGETLQRYLLQLNEKENLVLSWQFRNKGQAGGGGFLGSSLTTSYAAQTPAPNGGGAAAGYARAPKVQPKEPPPGAVRVLNRDSLDAVLTHLVDYEANAQECLRGLRALSSLAYADASTVGERSQIQEQVVRVMGIHPDEDQIKRASMGVFCNMAYSPSVALNRLVVTPGVLSSLIMGKAKEGANNKEISEKASEAIARIVAAEVNPELAAEVAASTNGAPQGLGALGSLLFEGITAGESICPQWVGVLSGLVSDLIKNEVLEGPYVAKRFVAVAPSCLRNGTASLNWLQFAKALSAPGELPPDLPQALVDDGGIGCAAQMMEEYLSNGPVQLAGIEGMSSLVGNRWSGLQAFADEKGMRRIELAMDGHVGDAVLQTKGIRALASGIAWPEDVQTKANYSFKRSVQLTKAAMAAHGTNSELQIAGLEALQKYLDKNQCIDEVKSEGGEGLVKAMMTRHQGIAKVQQFGRAVLTGIGVDKNWIPKNAS